MNEVTVELGCDWHTVKDAVIAHGTALVDHHPNRIGQCSALGLDEPLLYGVGERRPEHWSTFRAKTLQNLAAWLAMRSVECTANMK